MASAKLGSTIFASSAASCFEDRGISGPFLARSPRLYGFSVRIPVIGNVGIQRFIQSLDCLLPCSSYQLEPVLAINGETDLLCQPCPGIRVVNLGFLQYGDQVRLGRGSATVLFLCIKV